MAVIKCDNETAVENRLLREIQHCVDRSVGPLFTVGLSGGSLPSLLTRVLPKVVTDWTKWRFFFCDERLVPFEDNESTFGVYRRGLLKQFSAISEKQFVTIDESLAHQQVAEDYERRMRAILGDSGALDLVLLGMGPDGHTCSLFPGHDLEESSKWVSLVTNSPKPPPERITLNLGFLEKCLTAIFVVLGESKADVLKEILVDEKRYPAGRVNSKTVLWLLDEKSGQKIAKQMINE